MRQAIKSLLKNPSSKHRSIFVLICIGIDQLAYDRDASHPTIMKELRGIKKHCEGLLAEKLAEAVTGLEIPPGRKRNHKRNQKRGLGPPKAEGRPRRRA